MIEINLVPDVKQELIKAQRVRTSVISIAILVGAAAIGIVIVLAIWVFGVQTARGLLVDSTIKDQSQKLSKVPDISNTLTVQNQLEKLPQLHESRHISSRTFRMLAAINPSAPNNISFDKASLDSANSTITISAQAENAYPALETFKKTIAATNIQFTTNGVAGSVPLATNLNDSERSYGEDDSGKKVLRFTLTFTYPQELYAASSDNWKMDGPAVSTNATDSFRGVPQSLFREKASDSSGGDQ